jgi:hypothetical protein
MADNLRDSIEEVCSKVLKEMNMTEEQMLELALKLAEATMSAKSKAQLEEIKAEADKGTPDDLETMYHMCFLSGYQCGMADEQRKQG